MVDLEVASLVENLVAEGRLTCSLVLTDDLSANESFLA